MAFSIKLVLARTTAILLRFFFHYLPAHRLNEWMHAAVARRYVNWRGLVLTAKTRDGAQFECHLADAIGEKIFYFGVWEPHVTAYLSRTLAPDRVFIDVGANIGYYSVIATRMGCRVVSIEASPTIFSKLKENVRRNQLKNIRLVNSAAGFEEGSATFYLSRGRNCGSSSLHLDRVDEGPVAEELVRVAPLSMIITDEEAHRCRLIKIDVEGGEYPILQNILSEIKRYPQDLEILVELSDKALQRYGKSLNALLPEFSQHGFNPYVLINSYNVKEYVKWRQTAPAQRLTNVPTDQVDLVLSRRSTAEL